jgi:hypothetical protein
MREGFWLFSACDSARLAAMGELRPIFATTSVATPSSTMLGNRTPGIHFSTRNRASPTLRIWHALGLSTPLARMHTQAPRIEAAFAQACGSQTGVASTRIRLLAREVRCIAYIASITCLYSRQNTEDVMARELQNATAGLLCAGLVLQVAVAAAQSSAAPKLLRANVLYSAFDGVHDFQVTVDIPELEQGSSPIDSSTLQWSFDGAYLTLEPYAALEGAVLVRPRRPGVTRIGVRAQLHGTGELVEDSALFVIEATTAVEVERGEAFFNPDGQKVGFEPLPVDQSCVEKNLPFGPLELHTCLGCHDARVPGVAGNYVSEQTATLSDLTLERLFAQGRIPADFRFKESFFMNIQSDLRACAFALQHAWAIPQDLQHAIAMKLRSLPQ